MQEPHLVDVLQADRALGERLAQLGQQLQQRQRLDLRIRGVPAEVRERLQPTLGAGLPIGAGQPTPVKLAQPARQLRLQPMLHGEQPQHRIAQRLIRQG